MSILLTLLIVTINPIKQLQKARDAQRQHDVFQIRNSLDAYYNDKNCYPISLTMGAQFNSGSTVYIQKVPQDPDFSNNYPSYIYETNQSQFCPQWNIIFAKLSSTQSLQTSCALTQLKNTNGNDCLPTNYIDLGYNYCVISGKVDCDYVSANPLQPPLFATPTPTPVPTATPTPTPTSAPTPTPTSAPTPTPTPIPTPTPVPFNCSPNYFAVSAGLCNIVTSNQCTIYGGSLTCYSGPGTTTCSGNLCTQ